MEWACPADQPGCLGGGGRRIWEFFFLYRKTRAFFFSRAMQKDGSKVCLSTLEVLVLQSSFLSLMHIFFSKVGQVVLESLTFFLCSKVVTFLAFPRFSSSS